MKNIIKTIAKSALLVAISFGFALAMFNAWDNECEYRLKKEFDYRYEHRFDEEMDYFSPDHLKEIRKLMPEGFRFEDWSYPEFDEIFNKAA